MKRFFITNILCSILILVLMINTKEHLCCEGGDWWFTIQMLVTLIFVSNLVELFLRWEGSDK